MVHYRFPWFDGGSKPYGWLKQPRAKNQRVRPRSQPAYKSEKNSKGRLENKPTTMSTLILYGISSNCLRRGCRASANPNIETLHRFIRDTDPDAAAPTILVDSKAHSGTEHACFCYLNYASDDGATRGKQLYETAIFDRLTRPEGVLAAAVDVSRMFACVKSEGPFHAWEPVFSVWVGNVCNVGLVQLVAFFSSFGPLSIPATYGSLPFKYVTGKKSYAIVNYIRFADAMALLHACASRRVCFRPRHPVIARPRANIIFIQRVLGAGRTLLTFEHALWLTKRMEDRAGFPGNAVMLLRSCPELFYVDEVSCTVALLV